MNTPSPFNIPKVSQPTPPPPKSTLKTQIIITIIFSIIIALGYQLIFTLAHSLGLNIISINQTSLVQLAYILFAQSLIIVSLTIVALTIRNPALTAISLATPPLILIITPINNPAKFLLIALAIICNSAYTYEIKKNTTLFIKFNLNRLILPHVGLLYLYVSLIISIPAFQYLNQSPQIISQTITDNIIAPIVKSTIKISKPNSDPTINFSAELLPPNLAKFATPETLLASLNESQFTTQQITSQVNEQINQIIEPFLMYIPYAALILISISIYQLSKIVSVIYLTLLWLIIQLFKSMAILEIRTEQKPVEILELN